MKQRNSFSILCFLLLSFIFASVSAQTMPDIITVVSYPPTSSPPSVTRRVESYRPPSSPPPITTVVSYPPTSTPPPPTVTRRVEYYGPPSSPPPTSSPPTITRGVVYYGPPSSPPPTSSPPPITRRVVSYPPTSTPPPPLRPLPQPPVSLAQPPSTRDGANKTGNVSPPPPPPPPPLQPPVSLPHPPSRGDGDNTRGNGKMAEIVGVPAAVIIVLVVLGFAVYKRRKGSATENDYFSYIKRSKKSYSTAPPDEDDITAVSSLQLDFKAIEAATSNFDHSNKLGQGGFGEVYKGTYGNGTEVAVKRLSKNSSQGEQEFKNEVLLVAKLQHRNLVRLLGFSVQGEEKILVYEYVPNKSLDYFLFDPVKKCQLDWARRSKIIRGITRGILYLHQDSRLTIIHRDLKASNILLDADMNPKIADFGMARNFKVDQTEANTGRVVGTLGYMPPEYVTNGHFSTKSDVYSFGVLILEIIGGKKNSKFHQIEGSVCNLVTYVWRLWNNESLLELVDETMEENYEKDEVIRCIHIGLLCVQENPADRPTMSTIFEMLTNTSSTLDVPQPPGFLFRVRTEVNPLAERLQRDESTSKSVPCSIDDGTITSVDPR